MECKFAPDKPINTISNEKIYQLYYPFGRHFSAVCRQKEEKSLNPVSSKLLSPLRLIPQEDITG